VNREESPPAKAGFLASWGMFLAAVFAGATPMTPEQQISMDMQLLRIAEMLQEMRDLPERVKRIDERLGKLGGWACGIVCFVAAHWIYDQTVAEWGRFLAAAAGLGLAAVLGGYFVRELR
jgi:hypothetical protein